MIYSLSCRGALLGLLCFALPRLTPAQPLDAGQEPDVKVEVVEADDQLVVSAERSLQSQYEAVAKVEVIAESTLRGSGVRRVADAMGAHAGVQLLYTPWGTGIGLNGFGPKHVLVLVDGVRQGGRVGGVIDLGRMSTANIERIEILRGASSALYGSEAMGGVINLITKRAGKALHLEFSSFYDIDHCHSL